MPVGITRRRSHHHKTSLTAQSLDVSSLASTSIGSEFRPIDKLKWILVNHPNWRQIQAKISNGNKYHTTPIEEKTRITDLRHQLLKSNHKSASSECAIILACPKSILDPSSINPKQIYPVCPEQNLSSQHISQDSKKMDIYLDYGITVSPDIGNNISRGNTAIPLAINAVSWPLVQK